MKTFLFCFINFFLVKKTNKESGHKENSIFIKSIDPYSKKSLIIEEGPYHVWAYLLTDDKQAIDFNGFLCTVVSPTNMLNIRSCSKQMTTNSPLPLKTANRFSWIKKLKREHITVEWKNNFVVIRIKGRVYLVMDKDLKISHSKALAKDCEFGNSL